MFLKTSLGLILGALSLTTQAIDLTNITVGVSAGSMEYGSDIKNGSVDDKSSTYSLIGQYNFKDNLKLEFSMSNFGEYAFDNYATEFSALTASAIMMAPSYQGFTPYGKLGYGFMMMTQKVDLLGTELENETRGDTLLAGIGFEYQNDLLPNLKLRMSYDYHYFKTSNLISSEDSNNNLSEFSLGVLYSFD
jgi:opacity protein-like surface antigen